MTDKEMYIILIMVSNIYLYVCFQKISSKIIVVFSTNIIYLCFTFTVSDAGIVQWEHPSLSNPENAGAVSVLSLSHVTQNRLYNQL
jgi:hypothetical protein